MAGSLALTSALPYPKISMGGMLSQVFGGMTREVSPITPNDEFYITSYRSPPDIRIHDWTLSVKGLVKAPIRLNYAELLARPTMSDIVTLECVGNEVAGDSIGTAEWEGVPLKAVLDEAGVKSTAYDVVLHAADGYSDSFSVKRAMVGDVMIAHKMNGVPLPTGHGYPARIIVPGIYGMKQVQWLTEIELVPHDHQGYYQKNGWSDDATVNTMTWITNPIDGDDLPSQDFHMKGFAFSGTRGIRSVEVSFDGGDHWELAHLEPAQSRSSWVFWNFMWKAPQPNRYTLVARATGGTGTLQSAVEQKPFPSGTTGLQEMVVTVHG